MGQTASQWSSTQLDSINRSQPNSMATSPFVGPTLSKPSMQPCMDACHCLWCKNRLEECKPGYANEPTFLQCAFSCTKSRISREIYFESSYPRPLHYIRRETSKEYVEHVKAHYGQLGAYRCLEDHCRVTFRAWQDLVRHSKDKHCRKPDIFSCPFLWCSRSGGNGFTRKDKLNDHVRNVHDKVHGKGKPNRPIKPAVKQGSFESHTA